MGILPKVFRETAQKITTNFDWFDIVTGKGYKRFYAGDHGTSGASTVLTTEPFYSQVGMSWGKAVNTVFTTNFDITIEKPFTVEGEAVLNIPIVLGLDAASTVVIGRVSGSVIIDQGGSETVLASGMVVREGVTGGSNEGDPKVVCLILDLPKTLFSKNDILRLRVERQPTTEGNVKEVIIAHDPMNRTTLDIYSTSSPTWTWETPTALTMDIPIIIKDL